MSSCTSEKNPMNWFKRLFLRPEPPELSPPGSMGAQLAEIARNAHSLECYVVMAERVFAVDWASKHVQQYVDAFIAEANNIASAGGYKARIEITAPDRSQKHVDPLSCRAELVEMVKDELRNRGFIEISSHPWSSLVEGTGTTISAGWR